MSADTTPPPPRHKELLDEWISNNYEEMKQDLVNILG